MIKNYQHYGVTVVKQVIDRPFKNVLKSDGVIYTDLPVADDHAIDIIKYTKDGQTKYAVIKDIVIPEEFCQHVYITSQIPDDIDWLGLINDIDQQDNGSEPAKMVSKLKMILDMADQAARENKMAAGNMDFMLNGIGVEDIGWALIQMGYGKDRLIDFGKPSDIDADYLNAIIEWIS